MILRLCNQVAGLRFCSHMCLWLYGESVNDKREEVCETLIRLGEGRDETSLVMSDYNEIKCNAEERMVTSDPQYPFQNNSTII